MAELAGVDGIQESDRAGWIADGRASTGYTLAASGNRREARAILDELKAQAAHTYVPPSNLALVHLALGEREEALNQLEAAWRRGTCS